ncbi:MAG: hypothetical protein WCB11_28245 [Terriglobales bacterium]
MQTPNFLDKGPPSKINSMLTVGSQGVYEWLVTDRQFNLLRICPDVVLGKYMAITSFDSGPLVLTDEEKAAGWESRSNIAYSPKIQDVSSLPRAEYDEWFIFGRSADLGTSHLGENVFEVPQGHGHLSVFVNYGFALHPPERTNLVNLFWPQMERIRPESYVADNDYLSFVSTNKTLFAAVHDAVKVLP